MHRRGPARGGGMRSALSMQRSSLVALVPDNGVIVGPSGRKPLGSVDPNRSTPPRSNSPKPQPCCPAVLLEASTQTLSLQKLVEKYLELDRKLRGQSASTAPSAQTPTLDAFVQTAPFTSKGTEEGAADASNVREPAHTHLEWVQLNSKLAAKEREVESLRSALETARMELASRAVPVLPPSAPPPTTTKSSTVIKADPAVAAAAEKAKAEAAAAQTALAAKEAQLESVRSALAAANAERVDKAAAHSRELAALEQRLSEMKSALDTAKTAATARVTSGLTAAETKTRLAARERELEDVRGVLDVLRSEKASLEREQVRLIDALAASADEAESRVKDDYERRIRELHASLQRWEDASRKQLREGEVSDMRARAAFDEALILKRELEGARAEAGSLRQAVALLEDKVAILAPTVDGHCAEDVNIALALVRAHRESNGSVDVNFLLPLFDQRVGGRMELDELRAQNADLIREIGEQSVTIRGLELRVADGDDALKSALRKVEADVAAAAKEAADERAVAEAVISSQAARIEHLTAMVLTLRSNLSSAGALAAEAAVAHHASVLHDIDPTQLVFAITIGHVSIDRSAAAALRVLTTVADGSVCASPLCVTVDAFDHAVVATPALAGPDATFGETFIFSVDPTDTTEWMLTSRTVRLDVVMVCDADASAPVTIASADVALESILTAATGQLAGLVTLSVASDHPHSSAAAAAAAAAGVRGAVEGVESGRHTAAAVERAVGTLEYTIKALRPLPMQWVDAATRRAARARISGGSAIVAGATNASDLPLPALSAASAELDAVRLMFTVQRRRPGLNSAVVQLTSVEARVGERNPSLPPAIASVSRVPLLQALGVEPHHDIIGVVSSARAGTAVEAAEQLCYVVVGWYGGASAVLNGRGKDSADTVAIPTGPEFYKWLQVDSVPVLVMCAATDAVVAAGSVRLTDFFTSHSATTTLHVEVRAPEATDDGSHVAGGPQGCEWVKTTCLCSSGGWGSRR